MRSTRLSILEQVMKNPHASASSFAQLLTISALLLGVGTSQRALANEQQDEPQSVQESGDRIIGRWLTQPKDAVVEITREGDKYVGNIVWLKEPNDDDGSPVVDAENPDRRLQDRPVLGLRILRDFQFDGNRWVDGRIYDPASGNDYRCRMSLEDDGTLRVRGFVGIAAFGRTEVWTRQDG